MVLEASNPRIWILVIKGHGNRWKGKQSDDGTGDHTRCMWEGKDNEVMEMIPMIVHVWCFVISKEWKKKWVCNQHVYIIQSSLSVTNTKRMY